MPIRAPSGEISATSLVALVIYSKRVDRHELQRASQSNSVHSRTDGSL